ncbi:hypothetical protein A2G06_01135 [Geobacter anodireducens]|nr:hypothetical protein A2G06_01135 [Geobacter anodireducens]
MFQFPSLRMSFRTYVATREPPRLFPQGEYAGTTEEGERQMRRGESDGPVVPVKAGNAAGGKGATHDSAE